MPARRSSGIAACGSALGTSGGPGGGRGERGAVPGGIGGGAGICIGDEAPEASRDCSVSGCGGDGGMEDTSDGTGEGGVLGSRLDACQYYDYLHMQ
jgi:hypothetical protein